MATIYDTLRLLSALGWVEWLRIGDRRYLRHPGRPGVQLILDGPLSAPLSQETLEHILEVAGLSEDQP